MSRIIPFTELSMEPERMVADAESLYKKCDTMRKFREPEWMTNVGFLAGDQWDTYVNLVQRHRKTPIQVPTAAIKLVSNKIYPLFRQALSSLTDNMPQEVAVPATPDEVDVAAAELATDFIQARLEADREAELRIQELLWLMTCGTIIRRTYWDPDLDGETVGGAVQRIGDLKTITLNPFRFHLFPWMSDPLDFPGFIESDVRDVEWINDTFKPKVAVEPEDCAEFRDLDAIATGIVTSKSIGSAVKREHAAILKRLFIAPSSALPQGRGLVWAGGRLLRVTDLPDGELLAEILRWFPIPGRVYSMPFVSPLRDIQREMNIKLSQMVELTTRQLRGDHFVQGEGEITQDVDPETGAKTVRFPLTSPKFDFIKYDLNTGDAQVLMLQFQNDMRDLAGIHEPRMGDTPARGQTATAVSILKDADMSGLTFFRNNYAQSMCRVARHKLILARNHYEVPRILRTVGATNTVNTSAFFGSDLRKTEDVRPKTTPMVSEVMKAQIRAQLAAAGTYALEGTPPLVVNKLMTLINSGLPDALQEVETLIAPLTVEDVKRINAKYLAASLMAQTAQAEAAAQAVSKPPQEEQEQAPQEPPVPMLVGGM